MLAIHPPKKMQEYQRELDFFMKMLVEMKSQVNSLHSASKTLENVFDREVINFTGKQEDYAAHRESLNLILKLVNEHTKVHERELSYLHETAKNYQNFVNQKTKIPSPSKKRQSSLKKKNLTPKKPASFKKPQTPVKKKPKSFQKPKTPPKRTQYIDPIRRLGNVKPPTVLEVETPPKPKQSKTPTKPSKRKPETPAKKKPVTPAKKKKTETPAKPSKRKPETPVKKKPETPAKKKKTETPAKPSRQKPETPVKKPSRQKPETPVKKANVPQKRNLSSLLTLDQFKLGLRRNLSACTVCIAYVGYLAQNLIDPQELEEMKNTKMSDLKKYNAIYKKIALIVHPDKGGNAELFKSLTNCSSKETPDCF